MISAMAASGIACGSATQRSRTPVQPLDVLSFT